MPGATRFLPPLLVVLLAVCCHVVALHGTEFTYDDVPLVEENLRLEVQGADDLWDLATSRYWGDAATGERLWRPVPLLSYAGDRKLHGNDPNLSRGVNVLLHAACSWLLFVLLASWIPRRPALLASVVFLCHPVHAEVTAGVVGRAEILALLGVLCAFWAHCRLRNARRGWARGAWGVGATCAFLLAFGSKEIALAGPVLLALSEFARCTGSRRRRLRAAAGVLCGVSFLGAGARLWRRLRKRELKPSTRRAQAQFRRGRRLVWPYLLYGAAIGAYLLARHVVLGDLVAQASGRTLGQAGLVSRVLVATLIYLDSWLSLALPHASSAHYPFGGVYLEPLAAALDPVPGRLAHEPTWGSVLSFVPFTIHALLLAVGAWLLLQRRRAGRVIGLGLWGFYLALGPVSNVLIPIGVLRADRLLYSPSVWACVALVAGPATVLSAVRRPWALRRAYSVLAAVLVGVCVWTLQGNLKTWCSNLELWTRSYALYPEQPRIQLALGQEILYTEVNYLTPKERRTFAEALFRAAVDRSPRGSSLAAKTRAALGSVLLVEGKVKEATRRYLEATQLDPRSVEASEGLTRSFLAQSNRAASPQAKLGWLLRAERTARQATRFGLNNYAVWLTYGTVLSALNGREQDALLAYDRAVGLRLNPWQAQFNRARLRAHLGDAEGALADYRAVAEYGLVPGRIPEEQLLVETVSELVRLSKQTGNTETQAWIQRMGPALPAVTPR